MTTHVLSTEERQKRDALICKLFVRDNLSHCALAQRFQMSEQRIKEVLHANNLYRRPISPGDELDIKLHALKTHFPVPN